MKRILILIFFLTSLSVTAQETYYKQSIKTINATSVYQNVSLGAGVKTVVIYNNSDSTCWAGFYSGGKDTVNTLPIFAGTSQYFYSKNTDTAYIRGSGTLYIGVIYGGGVSMGGGVIKRGLDSNRIAFLSKNNSFSGRNSFADKTVFNDTVQATKVIADTILGGVTTFSGQVKIYDGTSTVPSLSWNNGVTGFSHVGGNEMYAISGSSRIWGWYGSGFYMGANKRFEFYTGGTNYTYFQSANGSPEGVVTARIGSLYLRADADSTNAVYYKSSGTGNTGWKTLLNNLTFNNTFSGKNTFTRKSIFSDTAAFTRVTFDTLSGANGSIDTLTVKFIKQGGDYSNTSKQDFIVKKKVISGLSLASTQLNILDNFNSLRKFKITDITVVLRNLTGSISTLPGISIGTNSSAYDNIVSNATLAGLSAAGDISSALTLITSSEKTGNIFFKVGTAATGSGLTTLDLDITVRGIYTD